MSFLYVVAKQAILVDGKWSIRMRIHAHEGEVKGKNGRVDGTSVTFMIKDEDLVSQFGTRASFISMVNSEKGFWISITEKGGVPSWNHNVIVVRPAPQAPRSSDVPETAEQQRPMRNQPPKEDGRKEENVASNSDFTFKDCAKCNNGADVFVRSIKRCEDCGLHYDENDVLKYGPKK